MSRVLKRDLSILSWNANGLTNKIQELQELLARLKPDVVPVSYTHLDVYKRQALHWTFSEATRCYTAAALLPAASPGAIILARLLPRQQEDRRPQLSWLVN